MHTSIVLVARTIFSVKKLPGGVIVATDQPKDDFWKVVWRRKRKIGEVITDPLTKKEAVMISEIMNALPAQQAVLIVKLLHSFGGTLLAEHQRKHPTYTGRSFAREG